MGIDLVQQPSGLAADELDQGRHAQGPADVVHVEDQDHDARHHHDEGDDDRQTWHRVPFDVDLAEREDRVGERCHEQADGDLAWLVLQERLHDARRELTHRELHDDHRDGEDEGCKAHHRQRDGRQDRRGYLRSSGPLSRDHLIVAGPIDGERDDGQEDAAQHAGDRYEPKARSNMVEEAGGHRRAPYPNTAARTHSMSGTCKPRSAGEFRRHLDDDVPHQRVSAAAVPDDDRQEQRHRQDHRDDAGATPLSSLALAALVGVNAHAISSSASIALRCSKRSRSSGRRPLSMARFTSSCGSSRWSYHSCSWSSNAASGP